MESQYTEGRDDNGQNPPIEKDVADSADNSLLVEDKYEFQITRIDSLHADIDIPLSAKSGELVTVVHDGEQKVIKIPKGGYQGQSIRLKMEKNEEAASGGFLCCGAMAFGDDDEETPVVTSSQEAKNKKYENFPCTRVSTLHADIEIPEYAKPGDILVVEHDGDEKQVKVPSGGYQGQSIRVKMMRDE